MALRIRPTQPHDGQNPRLAALRTTSDFQITCDCDGQTRDFTFDRIFSPQASQDQVFRACALPLVDAVLEGRNGCIFAFGQTGSGKTHSMLGPEGGRQMDSQAGILPRTAAELFRRIAQLEGDAAAAVGAAGHSGFEVRGSFIEVYCESAFDLLGGAVSASRDPASACNIREQLDPPRVYAEGAREERITSVAQLLRLVAKGAANRATAATGVHEHSSRSHALLILTVENRWRDPSDPRKVISRTARLTMVDLAGAETMERSHGGRVDSAGVGTNLGLLVLGRVIQALADGQRVPYRDSTLTRLLQTSLGGAAKTHMLACVSPAALDAAMTLSTLKYAASARDVRVAPEIVGTTASVEDDPMFDDYDDEDASLNRRAIWIETRGFGDVFARCIGDPSDPLILWVHGSGPHNSSAFWNEVVQDVAVRARAGLGGGLPTGFYQVAIDCPGYGRSPGDRQTIRSYPDTFLSAVVESLGRRSAVAFCGSSQGCASTLNAALACPRLVHAVAECHPVTHAPERMTNLKQPTLLIYDTEDDGHPVSVGRQLRRYIPNNRYFEFARSKDGHWEAMHMGEELLSLLAANWESIKGKRRGGRADPKLPELIRCAGGCRAWSEQFGGEIAPMSGGAGWHPGADAEPAGGAGAANGGGDNVWRAVLDPDTNVMQYENVQSGRISRVRPPGATILVERLDAGSTGRPGRGAGGRGRSPPPTGQPLFEEQDEESEDEDARQERTEQEEQEAAAEREREASQIACDCCRSALFNPVRLVNCRCAICGVCVENTVRFSKRCPACGRAAKMEKGRPVSDAGELLERIAAQATADPELAAGLQQQEELAQGIAAQRSRTHRIVLEYGNTRKAAGSKTSYTTFVKVPVVDGPSVSKVLAKVDFNINPGFDKPTSTTQSPDNKAGGSFEYAMARAYPCHMTVNFAKELNLPKLSIPYWVQDKRKTSRRIIMEFPKGGLRRPAEAVFNAQQPQNGWVRCGQNGHEIRYMPEGEGGSSSSDSDSPKAGALAKAKPKAKPKARASTRGQASSPGRAASTAAAKPSSARGTRQRSTSPARSAAAPAAAPAAARGGAPRRNTTLQAAAMAIVAKAAAPAPAPQRQDPSAQPTLQRDRSSQLKANFRAADLQGTGMLGYNQLRALMPNLSGSEFEELMRALGAVEDSEVDYTVLCDFLYRAPN